MPISPRHRKELDPEVYDFINQLESTTQRQRRFVNTHQKGRNARKSVYKNLSAIQARDGERAFIRLANLNKRNISSPNTPFQGNEFLFVDKDAEYVEADEFNTSGEWQKSVKTEIEEREDGNFYIIVRGKERFAGGYKDVIFEAELTKRDV